MGKQVTREKKKPAIKEIHKKIAKKKKVNLRKRKPHTLHIVRNSSKQRFRGKLKKNKTNMRSINIENRLNRIKSEALKHKSFFQVMESRQQFSKFELKQAYDYFYKRSPYSIMKFLYPLKVITANDPKDMKQKKYKKLKQSIQQGFREFLTQSQTKNVYKDGKTMKQKRTEDETALIDAKISIPYYSYLFEIINQPKINLSRFIIDPREEKILRYMMIWNCLCAILEKFDSCPLENKLKFNIIEDFANDDYGKLSQLSIQASQILKNQKLKKIIDDVQNMVRQSWYIKKLIHLFFEKMVGQVQEKRIIEIMNLIPVSFIDFADSELNGITHTRFTRHIFINLFKFHKSLQFFFQSSEDGSLTSSCWNIINRNFQLLKMYIVITLIHEMVHVMYGQLQVISGDQDSNHMKEQNDSEELKVLKDYDYTISSVGPSRTDRPKKWYNYDGGFLFQHFAFGGRVAFIHYKDYETIQPLLLLENEPSNFQKSINFPSFQNLTQRFSKNKKKTGMQSEEKINTINEKDKNFPKKQEQPNQFRVVNGADFLLKLGQRSKTQRITSDQVQSSIYMRTRYSQQMEFTQLQRKCVVFRPRGNSK